MSKQVIFLRQLQGWVRRKIIAPNELMAARAGGEEFDDIVSLRGCQGSWAKVSWKESIGWLNPASQCSDLWDFCGER